MFARKNSFQIIEKKNQYYEEKKNFAINIMTQMVKINMIVMTFQTYIQIKYAYLVSQNIRQISSQLFRLNLKFSTHSIFQKRQL